MDLGGFIQAALFVIALVSIATAALFSSTNSNLRTQLKDSRDEAGALRATRDDDRDTIKELRSDVAALNRVVTGEVHWVALGVQLHEHHQQAERHWVRDEEILTEIRDDLRGKP